MTERVADERELKDLPYRSPTTEVVPVKGVNFEIYKELPYLVSAKVANLWIKSMMGTRSLESADLSETLHEILLAVVVKPKLTIDFLMSDRCPNEFIGIAMRYFTQIVQSFSLIDSDEEVEIIEDEE